MPRIEFVSEVVAVQYRDGRSGKRYTTLYIRIPRECRYLFRDKQRVKVVVETLD